MRSNVIFTMFLHKISFLSLSDAQKNLKPFFIRKIIFTFAVQNGLSRSATSKSIEIFKKQYIIIKN